jgi:GT2 family glycosyltransferase
MPAVRTRLLRRLRGSAAERERYAAFVEHVEPGLAARPRVHRFAVPPVLGDPGLQPQPVALIIDTTAGGDAAATRASIEAGGVLGVDPADPHTAAAVVEGDPRRLLGEVRAPWAAVIAAGDRLGRGALRGLGQAAALAGDAAVLTCDDDVLDRSERRKYPRCFPGPSPDLMRERDLTGSLIAFATRRLPARVADSPAWRYEVALRLAGHVAAGHAHVPFVLCHRAAGSPARPAAPAHTALTPPLRGEPAVEAIVCFRDRPDLLERCARSLLEGTSYDRLTLRLVDNGSEEVATADLLDRLELDPRVTVRRDTRPFNFAALNNVAAAESGADVLAFVNNDVEATEPDWLEPLLAHAQREEVGAVGPLLLRPDGRVQHAGVVIGIHGTAGHPFAGLRPGADTPFGTATDGVRNCLAVTAACLVVERRKFEAVGGFDEGFAVGGNDVDLGLRLGAAGHRSLCVPHVRLVHAESSTRDPSEVLPGDLALSRERYGDFLVTGDPFYNPNLTLADTSCAMRRPDE